MTIKFYSIFIDFLKIFIVHCDKNFPLAYFSPAAPARFCFSPAHFLLFSRGLLFCVRCVCWLLPIHLCS